MLFLEMNGEHKILIVEDELVLQLMLEQMLQKLGFTHFVKCTKGSEAVTKAQQDKFDLILMDIMLQDQTDGIEAYKQIKELYEAPVIYITGNTDPKNQKRAKKIGYHDYIGKPITFSQLRDAITSIPQFSGNGSHRSVS